MYSIYSNSVTTDLLPKSDVYTNHILIALGTIISLFLLVIVVKLFKKSKHPERKTLSNHTSGDNSIQIESLNTIQHCNHFDYLYPEHCTVDETDDDYEQISEYFETHLSTFSEKSDDYEIPVARVSPMSFSFCPESIDVFPNDRVRIEQTTEYVNSNSSAEIKSNHLQPSLIAHNTEYLYVLYDRCDNNIQQSSSEHTKEDLNACSDRLENYLTPLSVKCSSGCLDLCTNVSENYLIPNSVKCTTESEILETYLTPLSNTHVTECQNQRIVICDNYITPLSMEHKSVAEISKN